MKKQVVDITGIKKPPTGFNHVVKAGNFIFLSSQLSTNLQTGEILLGNISEQTKIAIDNIQYLLSKCGCEMDDIVKVVIYIRNPNDRQDINAVYKQYFTPGQEPAKVSIQAPSPIRGINMEIEVTAYIG